MMEIGMEILEEKEHRSTEHDIDDNKELKKEIEEFFYQTPWSNVLEYP